MPKKTKHPRLRRHVKYGKAGQVWVSFWFDNRGTGKPDVALGNDYETALAKWAALSSGVDLVKGTIEEAFAKWEREELPGYGAETRRDYAKSLKQLRPVFGPALWSAVRFPTLKAYLNRRTAKTRANREMSVLQVIWNWARGADLTNLEWPAAGMERSRWKNTEGERDVEVSDAVFAAIYSHADQTLRDAMDIASATGLRVRDVLGLRMSDARGDKLIVTAQKTGKRAEFDLSDSVVLPIIQRRRESKALHIFVLDAGGRHVTERMLHDRFIKARDLAAKDLPECAGLYLRDLRKRAAQMAGSLQAASDLLQHSSTAVTERHYRRGAKLRPVR